MQSIYAKIEAETVLFFDMDGTLVDTNYANFLSYMKAINAVTGEICNLIYDSEKRFNRSYLRAAVPNLSQANYEQIIQVKEKVFVDFLHETRLNALVSDILFNYSETNTVVLVTNCRKDRALATLNYYGLFDKFDAVFYRFPADAYKRVNKYQNAILKLNVSVNKILVFENEQLEIEDAVNAGIQRNNILSL